MRKIFSVLVENRAGVLSRTSGLFARRGFNIESLVVGETEDPAVSRMTIVSSGDSRIMEQIEKQLNKLVDVIKVQVLDMDTTIQRELLLMKVSCTPQNRGEILDVCNIMEGKIVDMSHTSLTIEICRRPEMIDLTIEMLTHYGIMEIARTGLVALQKGGDFISVNRKKGETK